MQSDIVVPAFEMDCRYWCVSAVDDIAVGEQFGGAPVLAVLGTAIITETEMFGVSAVLMLGLLDDDVPPALQVRPNSVAAELLDLDADASTVRYLLPCPGGQLALVAEFDLSEDVHGVLRARVEDLMASFQWSL